MEVLDRRPDCGASSPLCEYKNTIVDEIAPNGMLRLYRLIPKSIRGDYPLLERIQNSRNYDERTQQFLLAPSDIRKLDGELYQIRSLCRGERELFLDGQRFNGQRFMERWSGGPDSVESFEEYVRILEGMLQLAVTHGYWIMLSL